MAARPPTSQWRARTGAACVVDSHVSDATCRGALCASFGSACTDREDGGERYAGLPLR